MAEKVVTENMEIQKNMEHDRHPPLRLSGRMIKGPNSERTSLKSVDDVIILLKCYFLRFDEELATFPDIGRIGGGILYGHADEQGKPVVPTKDKYNEAGFKGEVLYFWCRCVGRLSDVNGLLLNNYNEAFLSGIFENVNSQERFEIDWVYVSSHKIAAFEVGMKTATVYKIIGTKITQVIERTSVRIQNLISSILKCTPEFTSLLGHLLDHHVFYVVCLPNVTRVEINTYLRRSSEIREKIEKSPDLIKSNILFMTEDTLDCVMQKNPEGAKLYKYNDGLLSDDQYVPLGGFLKKSQCTTCAESEMQVSKLCQYISGVLVSGFLIQPGISKTDDDSPSNFGPSFDINSRFKSTQSNYLEKQHTDFQSPLLNSSYNFDRHTDLILSPQQWEILHGNKQRMLLLGEAGAGKTTLLLLKLLQNCGIHLTVADRKKVVFCIPKSKDMFRTWLHEFVSKNCCHDFVTIMEIESIETLEKSFCEGAVVLVDEVYSDVAKVFKEIFEVAAGADFLWIACVAAEQYISPMYNTESSAEIHIENMTVLFRSSAHIASAATCLLHGSIREQFSSWSAWLVECFASKQTQLNVELLGDNVQETINSYIKELGAKKEEKVAIFYLGDSLEKEMFSHESLHDVTLIELDFRVVEKTNAHAEFPFTGVEFDHVLLVLSHSKKFHENRTLHLVYHVLTRAVYTFRLFTNQRYYDFLKNSFDQITSSSNQRLIFAAQTGSFTSSMLKTLPNLTSETYSKILELSLIRSDFNLFKHLTTNKNEWKNPNTVKTCIRALFASSKTESFLNQLTPYFVNHQSLDTDAMVRCWKSSRNPVVLQWILHVFEGSITVDNCKFKMVSDVLKLSDTRQCVEVLMKFIEGKFGRNEATEQANYALHAAKPFTSEWWMNEYDKIEFLLSAYMDGNYTDSNFMNVDDSTQYLLSLRGRNLIHFACSCGNLKFCLWFHERIIDVKMKPVTLFKPYHLNGRFPMHIACLNGQLAICKWLYEEAKKLSRGSDILNLKDARKKTPLMLAEDNNMTHIVEWLESVLVTHNNDSLPETVTQNEYPIN